jgi:hypothetical protein
MRAESFPFRSLLLLLLPVIAIIAHGHKWETQHTEPPRLAATPLNNNALNRSPAPSDDPPAGFQRFTNGAGAISNIKTSAKELMLAWRVLGTMDPSFTNGINLQFTEDQKIFFRTNDPQAFQRWALDADKIEPSSAPSLASPKAGH